MIQNIFKKETVLNQILYIKNIYLLELHLFPLGTIVYFSK